MSVLGRPQQRLRGGEHARFVSEFVKRPELDPRTAFMTKGDMAPENAQDEGITHGSKTGTFASVRRD